MTDEQQEETNATEFSELSNEMLEEVTGGDTYKTAMKGAYQCAKDSFKLVRAISGTAAAILSIPLAAKKGWQIGKKSPEVVLKKG